MSSASARFSKNAADGIFITSLEGRFLEVNARGLEMSGYSRDEFLALHIADLVAPRAPDDCRRSSRG